MTTDAHRSSGDRGRRVATARPARTGFFRRNRVWFFVGVALVLALALAVWASQRRPGSTPPRSTRRTPTPTAPRRSPRCWRTRASRSRSCAPPTRSTTPTSTRGPGPGDRHRPAGAEHDPSGCAATRTAPTSCWSSRRAYVVEVLQPGVEPAPAADETAGDCDDDRFDDLTVTVDSAYRYDTAGRLLPQQRRVRAGARVRCDDVLRRRRGAHQRPGAARRQRRRRPAPARRARPTGLVPPDLRRCRRRRGGQPVDVRARLARALAVARRLRRSRADPVARPPAGEARDRAAAGRRTGCRDDPQPGTDVSPRGRPSLRRIGDPRRRPAPARRPPPARTRRDRGRHHPRPSRTHLGRPEQEVGALLASDAPAPASDQGLVQLAQELMQLDREVRSG